MFIMREVIQMLNGDKQPIRRPDATVLKVPEGGLPTEQTDILDLTKEAQEVRDVLLEVMAEKGLGKATLKVERVCALLDPRRKSLDNSQIVNGSATLRTHAEEDLKAHCVSISSWWFGPSLLSFVFGVMFSFTSFCLVPCGFTTEY